MGKFYFVRHGQTVWNVENKICGATDIELTDFGHEQAIKTGEEILKQAAVSFKNVRHSDDYGFFYGKQKNKRGYHAWRH